MFVTHDHINDEPEGTDEIYPLKTAKNQIIGSSLFSVEWVW
jgi:hypothetical protein